MIELTACEKEVSYLVSKGLKNKDIALKLNRNIKTVKWHLTSVFKKMNIKSRCELTVKINELMKTEISALSYDDGIEKMHELIKTMHQVLDKTNDLITKKHEDLKLQFLPIGIQKDIR